jgi:hypothetical protein
VYQLFIEANCEPMNPRESGKKPACSIAEAFGADSGSFKITRVRFEDVREAKRDIQALSLLIACLFLANSLLTLRRPLGQRRAAALSPRSE